MIKNIKITNSDEIPCFCNLVNLAADKDQNPDDVSENLKRSGMTPYIYIRQSLKLLVEGEYNKSFRVIQYGGKIGSIF